MRGSFKNLAKCSERVLCVIGLTIVIARYERGVAWHSPRQCWLDAEPLFDRGVRALLETYFAIIRGQVRVHVPSSSHLVFFWESFMEAVSTIRSDAHHFGGLFPCLPRHAAQRVQTHWKRVICKRRASIAAQSGHFELSQSPW